MEASRDDRRRPSSADGPFRISAVTGYHWLVMLVAGGAWLFDNADQRVFSLARIPALTDLMGLPGGDLRVQAFAKTVTAVFLVGWGLGGLSLGSAGDRYGRVRVLNLSILVYALGTGATALSASADMFLVLRFLTGFGIGGVFGLAAAIIADEFEGRARIAMLAVLQILSTVGNIGAVLTKFGVDALAAGGTVAPQSSWRILFALGGLPAILALVGFVQLREPARWRAPEAGGGGILQPMRLLLADRRQRRNLVIGALLASAGVIGLWGIGEYAVDLQDAVFRDFYRLQGNADRVALLTAEAKNRAYLLQMIGATVGMLLFTWGADRFGRRPAFMAAFLAAFVMTVFTYLRLATPGDSLWMMPLMGMAQFSVFVGFSLYLPELFAPEARATGISFCYNIGRFAAAGGSLVSAALSTEVFGGYPAPLPLRYSAVAVSVVFLVGIVAAYLGPETGGRRHRASAADRIEA